MTPLAVWAVVLLLFGHWLADFVLQSDAMSSRKSKDWIVLAIHASFIMLGSWVVGWLVLGLDHGWDHRSLQDWGPFWFGLINGGSHFVIDAVTSRMTSRLYTQNRRHAFFVVIGFDQFLHTAIAVATLSWLVV